MSALQTSDCRLFVTLVRKRACGVQRSAESGCEIEYVDGNISGEECAQLDRLGNFARTMMSSGKIGNFVRTLYTLRNVAQKQAAKEAEAAGREAPGAPTRALPTLSWPCHADLNFLRCVQNLVCTHSILKCPLKLRPYLAPELAHGHCMRLGPAVNRHKNLPYVRARFAQRFLEKSTNSLCAPLRDPANT